jgi:hypothetical protein
MSKINSKKKRKVKLILHTLGVLITLTILNINFGILSILLCLTLIFNSDFLNYVRRKK